eukprot:jgi/Picsp_1/155/NSC_00155-R1_---NA---
MDQTTATFTEATPMVHGVNAGFWIRNLVFVLVSERCYEGMGTGTSECWEPYSALAGWGSIT